MLAGGGSNSANIKMVRTCGSLRENRNFPVARSKPHAGVNYRLRVRILFISIVPHSVELDVHTLKIQWIELIAIAIAIQLLVTPNHTVEGWEKGER